MAMIQPPAGETMETVLAFPNMEVDEQARRDETRARMIEDLFLWAANCRQPMEKAWKTKYEFYYGCDIEYRKKQAHQSKIVLPISFEIVETKTPQLVMSMFTQQPIYSLNAESSDDPYKAIIGEQILSWQLRRQRNAMLTHTLWIKDSNIYGGAIAQTGWDYQCEIMPRNIKLPPVIDFATQQIIQQHHVMPEKVVTKDQPVLTNCDIGEMYPDPAASDIEDCKFIIKRMLIPYVTLKQQSNLGLYKNVDKIERSRNVAHWASDFAQRRFSTHNFMDPFIYEHQLYDYVEILECWWIDPTDPQLKKWKTVVANRKHIIQDVPLGQVLWHNRFPFILLKNIPMTKEFWGISELDVTIPLQREANSLRNQRMDNINAMLKAYWIVARSSGVNKEKMKRLAPGDIIFTNDINGIKPDRPPSIDGLTFNAEAANRSDIQRAANLGDMVTGTPTRSQVRNATTASLMDQNAKTRWGLSVLLYTEQMQRVGEDFMALNAQFLTDPQKIAITGQDGLTYNVNVDYTNIPTNPDIFVTLGYEIQTNKELRKQLLLDLDGVVTTTPGANITQWRKDMLKDFGFKNPERYFEGAFVAPTEVLLGGGKGGQPHSSYTDQLSSIVNPSQPNQLSGGFKQPNVGEMSENAYN
jgi:hypothetical protein